MFRSVANPKWRIGFKKKRGKKLKGFDTRRKDACFKFQKIGNTFYSEGTSVAIERGRNSPSEYEGVIHRIVQEQIKNGTIGYTGTRAVGASRVGTSRVGTGVVGTRAVLVGRSRRKERRRDKSRRRQRNRQQNRQRNQQRDNTWRKNHVASVLPLSLTVSDSLGFQKQDTPAWRFFPCINMVQVIRLAIVQSQDCQNDSW